MLRPSPNHGTQRLPNDDDDDVALLVDFVYNFLKTVLFLWIISKEKPNLFDSVQHNLNFW